MITDLQRHSLKTLMGLDFHSQFAYTNAEGQYVCVCAKSEKDHSTLLTARIYPDGSVNHIPLETFVDDLNLE